MIEVKRIVLIIPSLHTGGMERVMAELANYWSLKPNTQLHLVMYGIKREIFYKLPSEITIHKPAFQFNNSYRIINSIKTLFFLRNKVKELSPDAMLSFGEYWNSFVLLALFGLKYPIYLSDRSQPDKRLSPMHEKLRKYLYPRATGIIAQTQKAKEIYASLYAHDNITVIGNPIREIDLTTPIIRENIVLTVGRLIDSKHHDKLIKIFLSINKPGWKLVIVGDDAIKQKNSVKLMALITDLKAENSVILAGSQTDVDSFYLKSKIFAFTSSSEGFPNVVGEAQSSGLPVVAFDCIAGPSDIITDSHDGFLVPLYNYQIFQERLAQLMDDDKLRMSMGYAAKESIRKFSVEKIGDSFDKFIKGNQQ